MTTLSILVIVDSNIRSATLMREHIVVVPRQQWFCERAKT